MLEIKFKKNEPKEEKQLNKQYVDDLRKDLPEIFDQVSDEMLSLTYSKWSQDNYAAGWLYHTKESLRLGYLTDILLVDRFGNEIDPLKEIEND